MTTLARSPIAGTLASRDFLSIDSISRSDIERLIAGAGALKRSPRLGLLSGRSVALIFEKPSLRTRVSFEVGVHRLGGQAIYLDQSRERLGARESIHDAARTLERYVHAIVARVYEHATLDELARHASIPIVNALSDRFHPCQALGDMLTLRERLGPLQGRTLTYLGDANNVCHSLVQAASLLGMHARVITPAGCTFDRDVLAWCRARAGESGGSVATSHDRGDARASDAVYTDAWVSMGLAARATEAEFRRLQVDAALMRLAESGRGRAASPTIFMHCLPAARGQEVTDDVIDSPASVVFDQAENRLHAQNALLAHLLGDTTTIAG